MSSDQNPPKSPPNTAAGNAPQANSLSTSPSSASSGSSSGSSSSSPSNSPSSSPPNSPPTWQVVVAPSFETSGLEAFYKSLGLVGAPTALRVVLVYPFQAEVETDDLADELDRVALSVPPFKVLARDVTGFADGFLLLNIKAGNDRLVMIRDLLYAERLRPFANPFYTFFPHILIGKAGDKQKFQETLKRAWETHATFEGRVAEIHLERINPADGRVTIEYTTPLGGNA